MYNYVICNLNSHSMYSILYICSFQSCQIIGICMCVCFKNLMYWVFKRNGNVWELGFGGHLGIKKIMLRNFQVTYC